VVRPFDDAAAVVCRADLAVQRESTDAFNHRTAQAAEQAAIRSTRVSVWCALCTSPTVGL